MAGKYRLPPMPSISEIIRLYQVKAKKSLSQNFLLDMNINRKIVKSAGDLNGAYVCEIGPGPGGITRALIEQNVKGIAVVEKDRRFIPGLQMLGDASGGIMKIYHGDILRYDMDDVFPEEMGKEWEDECPNLHIIGNLPFNISNPLTIQLLHAISERRGPWKHGRVKLTLTYQKEVGERMTTRPGVRKQRCRFSLMCQYLCNVSLKFVIPGSCFTPPPKVQAAVVTLEPLVKPLISVPFKTVERVTRHVFIYKNKFLRSCIKTLFPPDMPELTAKMFELTDINPEITATQLTNEEIGRLCHVYAYLCKQHPYIETYDHSHPKTKSIVQQARQLEIEKIEKQILYGPDVKIESVIANKDNT